MNNLLIIEPGSETAAMLEYHRNTLLSLGIPPRSLYSDIVETIRRKNAFNTRRCHLVHEIKRGVYFGHKFTSKGITDEVAENMRHDLGMVANLACLEIFRTLVDNGLYDQQGLFPHEYIDFRGGVFCLKPLP